MPYTNIISRMPHQPPFRFVDVISAMDENGITGSYTFKQDEYFLKGHYPQHPIVPGFIVTECMVQIGLVAFGISLLKGETERLPVLTDAQADFFDAVYPGDTLTVKADKIYFRFHKLRCNIAAINQQGKEVCRGVFSGMLVPKQIA
jgi:3-hydroxyacyl-[acyl-carrier-protein] dehydratase